MDNYWRLLQKYPFSNQTIIVGHSSGAVAALRCLERIDKPIVVKRVISVAGFVRDEGWNCQGLFRTPIDWATVKRKAQRIDVIASDDDPYISQEQTQLLSGSLDVEPVMFAGYGHFNLEAGARFTQFPELLEMILS